MNPKMPEKKEGYEEYWIKRINDKILNILYQRGDLNKNEIFVYWDLIRSCFGEFSCIAEHNAISGEIMNEINHEMKVANERLKEE